MKVKVLLARLLLCGAALVLVGRRSDRDLGVAPGAPGRSGL